MATETWWRVDVGQTSGKPVEVIGFRGDLLFLAGGAVTVVETKYFCHFRTVAEAARHIREMLRLDVARAIAGFVEVETFEANSTKGRRDDAQ